MVRKSYQQGFVKKVRRSYGIAYMLYWRERRADGSWKQRTKTLRDCPDMKTAKKELAKILRKVNGRNGLSVKSHPMRFYELLDSLWPNYMDTKELKPSTRYSYESVLGIWILPFFENMLLDEVSPVEVGQFMAHLSSKGLSSKYKRNI